MVATPASSHRLVGVESASCNATAKIRVIRSAVTLAIKTDTAGFGR